MQSLPTSQDLTSLTIFIVICVVFKETLAIILKFLTLTPGSKMPAREY